MTKDELQELVDRLPDDADDEQIEELDDLISRAIDMEYLLLMRAAFRLRNIRECGRNPYGIQAEPEEDEEDLT